MQWLIRLEPGQVDRYYQKEASEKKKVGIFFALSLNPPVTSWLYFLKQTV